jgi:acyl-CoA thioesterase I|tara:strand:- start:4801 stop:5448 length:648 start_codon:yes stop_codon:yes gene_type:complete
VFYSLRNIAFVFLLLIPTFAQSDQHDSDEKEPNAKLLILGDSLSAAYGLRQEEGWVSLLQNTWRDENIPIDIVNAAVSGETTDGGLARLPRLLTQHQPSHVLIELGGNDGLQGHNVKKIRSNLVALVKIAQAADAKVFLQDMQIPTNYGKRYTNMFGESFDRVGEELNVPVIPFFLQNIALDTSLMQRDGIHPNAEAQALIAEFMHRQLMPLFDN